MQPITDFPIGNLWLTGSSLFKSKMVKVVRPPISVWSGGRHSASSSFSSNLVQTRSYRILYSTFLSRMAVGLIHSLLRTRLSLRSFHSLREFYSGSISPSPSLSAAPDYCLDRVPEEPPFGGDSKPYLLTVDSAFRRPGCNPGFPDSPAA